MLVHAVHFSLNSDLPEPQLAAFRPGLASLTTITTVRSSHIGVPAPTDRPVIERGYSYALVVQFDDEAGQEYLQRVDIRGRSRQTCWSCWSRVVIYASLSVWSRRAVRSAAGRRQPAA